MITPKITTARKRERGSRSDALTSYTNSRSKTRTSKPKDRQFRVETDSLGQIKVASDRLWGAQTQRSLEHFSIGKDLIPREMITAYATLKKGAAKANHAGKRLDDKRFRLIVQTCDEILAGQHARYVSVARLDDRQRHAIQHERERGDLEPLLPARRHAAWKQDAGPSERSR